MPELPEVETITRGLQRVVPLNRISGVTVKWTKTVASSSPAKFKRGLIGRQVKAVNRRGKFIIMKLTGDWFLVLHLKLTGRLIWRKGKSTANRLTRLAVAFGPAGTIYFDDLRKFGRVWLLNREAYRNFDKIKNLGPEPLDPKFSFELFYEIIRAKPGKIKTVLLDQKNVAGLGNIYADESLFRSRIHPFTRASSLSRARARRLYQAIRYILEQAIKARGTSDRDYLDSKGEKGYFQNKLKVYRQTGEKCPNCGGKIRRLVLAGRGTHVCPRCQKRPEFP